MVKIKKATKRDIPKVLELAKEFIEEYRKISKAKSKVTVDSALNFKKKIFNKDLSSGNGAIFLVEENNIYVGYIFVLTFIPGMENAKKYAPGYVSDLHIKKKYRKKGFAIKLIKESEKWLKKKNKKEIALDVGTFNKSAINLYKKMKFKDKSIKFEKNLK